MNRWAGQPLPITATCYTDGVLYVRLSGSARTIGAARERMGGELFEGGKQFWLDVREHRLPALQGRLWRLSVRSTTPPIDLPGTSTLEWNGSLRWIATDASAEQIHAAAGRAGGHATLFRGAREEPIMQLRPNVLTINRRIKQALDPKAVFGPHRLHAEF
jgi:glycolate oxidase FAD binding subunit